MSNEKYAHHFEISTETLIYSTFPDTMSRDSVFANGGADAQWTISIPKTYSKPIPYSNTYPKPNPSLILKFDKKCLKRNRLTVYGKRTIWEFQDITGLFRGSNQRHAINDKYGIKWHGSVVLPNQYYGNSIYL